MFIVLVWWFSFYGTAGAAGDADQVFDHKPKYNIGHIKNLIVNVRIFHLINLNLDLLVTVDKKSVDGWLFIGRPVVRWVGCKAGEPQNTRVLGTIWHNINTTQLREARQKHFFFVLASFGASPPSPTKPLPQHYSCARSRSAGFNPPRQPTTSPQHDQPTPPPTWDVGF